MSGGDIYREVVFIILHNITQVILFFINPHKLYQQLDSLTILIKRNKMPRPWPNTAVIARADVNRVIQLNIMNWAALPGKQDHALMDTLTAETANSSPRETQLITRATTPNKHTLGRAREGEKSKYLELAVLEQCYSHVQQQSIERTGTCFS